MMIASPIEKDVEAQLLNERKCRRRPGEVPYPLDYSTDMLNFDIWDHMFLTSCCRNLTMHQFDEPPPMVLDLGCGGGYWVIEAALQWKDSAIIGFDLKEMQPRLGSLDIYKDLARRVKWVHGNVLDGLPFPPDHFDFVRIVGIGLGVPEDEWQYVLEEVARIMKPGAVIEIIEEDLIFPCGRPPKLRPPLISVDYPMNTTSTATYSARSSATLLSDPWSTNTDEQSDISQKKNPSLATLHESPESMSPISPRSPFSPNSSFNIPTPSPFADPYPHAVHPQDHTRLEAAWEAMLSNRFLAPQLITVLPFYLSSTFIDVQTHPSLQISLPPNSYSHQKNGSHRISDASAHYQNWFDPDMLFELKMSSTRRSSEPDNYSVRSTKSSQRKVPSWAPMHLAKTVNTIIGCKEAIWIEYEKLYGDDPSIPSVTRSTRFKDPHLQISRPSSREGFERAWANWENDMMDRIGMRGRIISECLWNEPMGDRPDWRIWRSTLDTTATQGTTPTHSVTPEICRSLRGFVGRKHP